MTHADNTFNDRCGHTGSSSPLDDAVDVDDGPIAAHRIAASQGVACADRVGAPQNEGTPSPTAALSSTAEGRRVDASQAYRISWGT
jgi:hypothetical protein